MMKMREKLKKINMPKRTFSVLLAMVTLFGSLTLPPMEAEAAETGDSNAYILEVDTGVSNGSKIEFFEIKYTGTDNKTYKQFLFPGEDSLANGLREVRNYGSDENILKDMDSYYHYSLDANKPWEVTGKGSGLQSNSVDQYYFTTEVGIDTVLKIDAFMGNAGTWTCRRLQLFKVDSISGLRMAGVWSNTWYIDYKGKLIAEITDRASSDFNVRNSANYLRTDQNAKLKTNFSDVSYGAHTLQEEHTYGFRMDFADIYGAGLESLIMEYSDDKEDLNSDKCIAEMLTYTIQYNDIYGNLRTVSIPVITSLGYQTYKSLGSGKKVWGLAQQGETIGLTAEIPDFSSLKQIYVTSGAAEAMKVAKIKYTGNNDIQKRRIEKSETDDMRLTCLAVYDMKNSALSTKIEGAQCVYDFTGTPILYRKSANSMGDAYYAAKENVELNLLSFPQDGKKEDLEVPNNNKYFLINIKTDSVLGAATVSDLYMTLNYVNFRGNESSSSEISLSQATGEYYGYWPGSTENFAYKWGVNAGNTISVLVSLNDVDYFTGIRLRLKNQDSTKRVDDDYQCKGFQIYSLTSLGKRKVVWEDLSSNGFNTRVNITRPNAGETSAISILNTDKTVLVQEGQDVNVDFRSAAVSTLVENSWNMEDVRISYEEAMQDFNFTKVRKTYNVTVNVFDDSVATDDYGNAVVSGGNGDAGSENLFYFQLIFENGSSCYELANSQLEGDRFASGAAESFQISTNQDYGEVKAVRIIADDTSSDSKKFDKLRIESIKVTEAGKTGTHDCWVATDIGWVGVGYTEEQEQTSMGGRKGRTAAEMGKTKAIDYVTNVVQVEVAIHTNTNKNQSSGYANQLFGTMQGQFTVVMNNGERKTLDTFDVVQKMYQYMNKKSGPVAGGTISDKTRMFREGHTDRFLVDIEDVKQIVALDLTMEAKDNPYDWAIGSVTLSLVTDEGRLRMNANDEYQYERDEEPELLCHQTSETTPAYLVKAKAGSKVTVNIPFTDNELNLNEDVGVKGSKITRVPASQDDTLNVFVFPTIGKSSSIDNYDLNVLVDYAHIYGPLYQSGCEMNKFIPNSADKVNREMFYVTGLRAEGMIDLNHVQFKAKSTSESGGVSCNLDYAIVQQVRAGVVVANYYMDLGDADARYSVSQYSYNLTSSLGYQDTQTLTFQFGDSTVSRNLFPGKQDMAVALKYKLANDPTDTEYQTPYVFLTDQDVVNIRPGQVVDINYNQMFVGEVTGVVFAGVGIPVEGETGDNVVVEAACVQTARTDNTGKPTQKGYYSFGNSIAVSVAPVTSRQTSNSASDENTIRFVTFGFKTAEAGKLEKSGTSDKVWMRVTTERTVDDGTDSLKKTVLINTVEKDDIRKYLVDGKENFETDQMQYVRFAVRGADAIRRIEIEPRSSDLSGNAGWTLSYITAQMDGREQDMRRVDERLYEGQTKRVSFANVNVKAYYYNYNPARNGASDSELVQSTEPKSLIAAAGQKFIIEPIVNGSELGCNVTLVEMIDNQYESGALVDLLKKDGSNYYFIPPETEENTYYRITVASAEVPEAKVVFLLTVKGTKETTDNTNDNGSGNNEGNSGGDNEAGGNTVSGGDA